MTAFYCKKCGRICGTVGDNNNICDVCGATLYVTPEEYLVIKDVGIIKKDRKEEFIEKCIKSSPEFSPEWFDKRDSILHQKNSEYREMIDAGKSMMDEKSRVPKCPTCQSTNIEKISAGKKAVGGALFGLFSSNARNTFHCKNCGYKW